MQKMGHFMILVAIVFIAGCGSKAVQVKSEFDPSKATDEQKLVYAVRDGDTGTVEQYLKDYPNVLTSPDSTGNTLVHHAAMGNQTGVIKLLVDAGADINARNWDDLTPLGAAIDRKADPSTIAFLESNGGVE